MTLIFCILKIALSFAQKSLSTVRLMQVANLEQSQIKMTNDGKFVSYNIWNLHPH